MPVRAADEIANTFNLVDKAGWVSRLVRTDKGVLLPVLDNAVSILVNDERWQGVIAYDEFAGVVRKLKAPPMERAETGEWMDIDDARLEHWLAEVYGMRRLPADALQKAVLLAADANRFHDVRAYLEGLTWDGTPRLMSWLWAYLGAKAPANDAEPGSSYVEKVAVKWMVGAVARVYKPGCKMDNVLILEGPQDAGKSSALKILFDPWFTDAAFEIGSTDGYQIMRGMWCVELAELDGFNRADSSRAKAFFTRVNDRYRNPYGRKPVNVLRQGVFAGSVNHATYLKDDTGNRRYWPVSIGNIGLDDLRKDRDQLWAEALQLYKAGQEWWVRASERSIYEGEQEARYIGDAYETKILNWLDTIDEGGVKPNNVPLAKIMGSALGLDAAKWTLPEQQRAGRIMARLGWLRKRSGGREGREWVYARPGEAE
jgi:predicted P-loop ATPase